LEEQKMAHAVHYPLPLHRQPCFAELPGAQKTIAPRTERAEQAERAAREVVNLYL
jgi:dTDP-4-amino-4,6-dideoxygalactose transaminase